MKKAIIVLSVILAVLLIIAGILYFTDILPDEPAAEALPSTEPSAEPPTQPPTEPETTEAPSTEPALEILPYTPPVVLNGKTVESLLIEGVHYIAAGTFAQAAELTVESDAPLKLSGTDTVEEADGVLLVNGAPCEASLLTVGETLYLEFDPLTEALGYPCLTDGETGIRYYTPTARRFDIPENVNVPVLMYHAVSDDMWGINELFVSPSSMEEQLAYLTENGYDAIWFEDLAHVEDYDKPVILTFDDGYDDNYTELFPLLQKYNVKATVFVIGNAPGTSHKATEEQIREMSDSGLVSIQSHSYTHADLDTLGYDDTVYELEQSKLAITRITGKEPYVLCYPTGKYNDCTLEVAPQYYMFGIKMVGGLYSTSQDPFLVNRYYVSRYTDIYTFAAYLSYAGT